LYYTYSFLSGALLGQVEALRDMLPILLCALLSYEKQLILALVQGTHALPLLVLLLLVLMLPYLS
jgi:hypothetical protein